MLERIELPRYIVPDRIELPVEMKDALQNVQVVVVAHIVIPGVALVEKRHIERGRSCWKRNGCRPSAGALLGHRGVGDPIPVVIAPVHGEARGATDQSSVIGDRYRLAMNRTGSCCDRTH